MCANSTSFGGLHKLSVFFSVSRKYQFLCIIVVFRKLISAEIKICDDKKKKRFLVVVSQAKFFCLISLSEFFLTVSTIYWRDFHIFLGPGKFAINLLGRKGCKDMQCFL